MPKPSEIVAKGWCQGKSAANKHGRVCSVWNKNATNFCLLGAISKAYPDQKLERTNIYQYLGNKLKVNNQLISLVTWNDTSGRTQAEVVAVLQSIGE
jgi:hypothetical protein